MLKINHISTGYSGKSILKDVSFSAPRGKVTVLFGPNGCGKSTLLKSICGALPLEAGEVIFEEENILRMEAKKLAQKVTYLSQGRRIPDITVRRLVLHGRFPYLSYPRRYRKEDYEAAEQAMEKMGITELADRPLEQLSGGQRQKVYIAMALAQNTPIILLDEPTTYLDMKHQLQMIQKATELAKEGKTVLLVVHDLDQGMSVADHIVLLSDGEVVVQGSPEEVYLSGKLSEVFGVTVSRVKTERSWHYFCEEE